MGDTTANCVVILLKVSNVVHHDLIAESMANPMVNPPWEANCHYSNHCLQRGRSKLVFSPQVVDSCSVMKVQVS